VITPEEALGSTLAHVDRVFAEGQQSADFDPYNLTETGCIFYNAAVRPRPRARKRFAPPRQQARLCPAAL
jgi:hypothetical protein